VNRPPPIANPAPAAPPRIDRGRLLAEDTVKAAVRDFLSARGLHVEVRWGRAHGKDIVANGPNERWVIEAKGEVTSPQQQGNYFSALWGN
jgi:hypothetical protein